MAKKRILIFSVPFSGHLNVLKEMILKYNKLFEFRLVITGWKNIPANLGDLKPKTRVLAKSALRETDPALWTFPRAYELLEDCIAIARKFKPDLIVYDYFSLEGFFAGKLLGIPAWCSIPAMIGPFTAKGYLRKKLSTSVNNIAVNAISDKFGITIKQNEIEMVSDGLHMPSHMNIIWSYPFLVPADFMRGRKKERYVFAGRLFTPMKHTRNQLPLVYFSFGTVVLNNLWNQQNETRDALKRFVAKIAKLWKGKGMNIIFVSQGKKILGDYPANWEVVDTANQVKLLSKADVFITHGGNNGFVEAAMLKVPMVVIPFFGDQILVGKQAQKLGIGINLGQDANIDTHKSKAFLNEELAVRLDKVVVKILDNPSYRGSYRKLLLRQASIPELLMKALLK